MIERDLGAFAEASRWRMWTPAIGYVRENPWFATRIKLKGWEGSDRPSVFRRGMVARKIIAYTCREEDDDVDIAWDGKIRTDKRVAKLKLGRYAFSWWRNEKVESAEELVQNLEAFSRLN